MSHDPFYSPGSIPMATLKPKQVRKNTDLTWWENLYLPEIARGLAITTKHLLVNLIGYVFPPSGQRRKVFTIYYPEEKSPIPVAYRGRPALVQKPDGREKCVACGLCERICPAGAISIAGGERENLERYPVVYNLDLSRCVFCGFCEEVCPKEAIVMSVEYEGLAEYNRPDLVYPKAKLLIPQAELAQRIDYIRDIYAKRHYRAPENLASENS